MGRQPPKGLWLGKFSIALIISVAAFSLLYAEKYVFGFITLILAAYMIYRYFIGPFTKDKRGKQ